MPDEEFLGSIRTVPASERHRDTAGAITQCRRGGTDMLGRCDQNIALRVQKKKKKVVLVFFKHVFWQCFYANLKGDTLTFRELLKKSYIKLVLQPVDCFGCSSWSRRIWAGGTGLFCAGLNWWERHWDCF